MFKDIKKRTQKEINERLISSTDIVQKIPQNQNKQGLGIW